MIKSLDLFIAGKHTIRVSLFGDRFIAFGISGFYILSMLKQTRYIYRETPQTSEQRVLHTLYSLRNFRGILNWHNYCFGIIIQEKKMSKVVYSNTNELPPKTRKITYIRERIEDQGRLIKWYADKLGYNEGSSEFYKIVQGAKAPNTRRRVLLAGYLQTTPDKLWCICPKTGYIVAVISDREISNTVEGRTIQRKENPYISITKEMESLMDKWEEYYDNNESATEASALFDKLMVSFYRFRLTGKAKIKREIWKAAKAEIEKQLKRKEFDGTNHS